MTLSEFKGWFAEQVLSFHRDPGNTRALGMISSSLVSAFMIEAEKKLASVEDGAEDMQEITCPCCDARFKVAQTKIYKLHSDKCVVKIGKSHYFGES